MIRTANYNYYSWHTFWRVPNNKACALFWRAYNMCLESTAAGRVGFLHALPVLLTYTGTLHTFQYNSYCSACSLQ